MTYPEGKVGRGGRAILVVVSLIYLVSPILAGDEGSPSQDALLSFQGVEKIIEPAFLLPYAEGQRQVGVIVLMRGHESYEGRIQADFPERMRAAQEEIRTRRSNLLAKVSLPHFEVGYLFDNIPGFSCKTTFDGIKFLAGLDEVGVIEEDGMVYPMLRQGIALINGSAIRTDYNGQGVAIAVVDSGIDYTHPLLGGGTFPNAKVIGGYDFGDNDPDPFDCHGHGTMVSGIAAGDLDTRGDYIGGVAHNAKLYALKVGAGCTGGGTNSAIAAAWDWAVTHKNDDPSHPILILNTSLGGGYNTASCDGRYPTTAAAARNLSDNGIALFCSSGNNGYCDGLSHPACLTSAISVGAVADANAGAIFSCISNRSCIGFADGANCSTGWACRDGSTWSDLVVCYSNSSPMLDLLAPANWTHTTCLWGGNQFQPRFAGTSSSSPYAAGAGAVLQSWASVNTGTHYTPIELRDVLVATGDPVTDPKNSVTKPRINLGRAVSDLEDCFNGVDDDADTLADCDDPDCRADEDLDGYDAQPCGEDCDDADPRIWRIPAEATGLNWTSKTRFQWQPLATQAGWDTIYQVVRGLTEELPVGAGASETCLGPFSDTQGLFPESPPPGGCFYYIVRGTNDCPGGQGPYGDDSNETSRATLACP